MSASEKVRSNEELISAFRSGDLAAIEQLLIQNRGLLMSWARDIQERCGVYSLEEDLVQEGMLALMESIGRFDESRGVKLMTYVGPAVRTAMLEYAARAGAVVSIPDSRLSQLRQVSWLCASAPVEWNDAQLVERIYLELNVSVAGAQKMLTQTRTFLHGVLLGERDIDVIGFGNPAVGYERKLLRRHLHQLVDSLKSREKTLVRYYFGLDGQTGTGMTFEELAVRLNYNSASGAEKALKRALKKLREIFYSREYGAWVEARKAVTIEILLISCQ